MYVSEFLEVLELTLTRYRLMHLGNADIPVHSFTLWVFYLNLKKMKKKAVS